MKTTLTIEGMTCDHCVARVRKIIEKFEDVTDTEVKLDAKEARFSCERETQIPEIIRAINDFGYSASLKG